jgi:hypothetical protein
MNDGHREIAEALERLIGQIDRGETSQVELEKLRSGLALVMEREKQAIARDSDQMTWVGMFRLVTPLILTGMGAGTALLWQSCEHRRDEDRTYAAASAASAQAAASASAAADREAKDRAATREVEVRRERLDLVRELAEKVTATWPPPVSSCTYALGIWHDYAKDQEAPDDMPDVLSNACLDAGVDAKVHAEVSETSAVGAREWLPVLSKHDNLTDACREAKRAVAEGFELVRVFKEDPNTYVTTSGAFETRARAVGYLQVLQQRSPMSYVVRVHGPKWHWQDCRLVDAG